jgi:signal transduction histidine kinase
MTASTISSGDPSLRPPSDRAPPPAERGRRRVRPNAWLATVGIWALVGLVSLGTRQWPGIAGGPGAGSRPMYHLVHILTLGALTGLVVWITRRTETWKISTRAGLHITIAAIFAWLVTLATAAAQRSLTPGVPPVLPLTTYELHFLAYFAVLAITHAIDFLGWRRDQRVKEAQLAERTARLETQLARTELQILRSQLDPHFLFNALHVISELVHVDPGRADRMVARLGDLLRMSATLARSADVPLRSELEFVNAYLEIQQARFGGKLRVVRDVDLSTLDAAVPSLLVQPLVENAIRHGTSRRAGGGQLEIATRRLGRSLLIEVRDDGPGLPADGMPDEGIGIGHTRARLAHLYGAESTLELESRPGGGTTARLRLPYVRAVASGFATSDFHPGADA